jgi:DNA polymerase/3'-5' exonuclease PolX
MKIYPKKEAIVNILSEIATLLHAQDASFYRVEAYKKAADFVKNTDVDIVSLAIDQQEKHLIALPTIGVAIAKLIIEYVHTKKSRLLNRLKGQINPEALIETIPGIGEKLAENIVRQLKIHTLEELEIAAHDGRLSKIKGMGKGRLNLVQMYLASALKQRVPLHAPELSHQSIKTQPSVEVILKIDNDYRRKAKAGQLYRIRPTRFNPTNKVWLPIYHVERDGWHFTVMYSNTARAHELKKTNDWVILYYLKDDFENQVTVVTEQAGILAGRRVVKGRIDECIAYYNG